MINIGINRLAIELTRWCEQQCPICMCGERENVFIDKKFIDCFFENPEYKIDSINSLFLTGGEPTLALEEFRYISNKLKALGIEVNRCGLITNGLNYNEEFLKELARLNGISISNLSNFVNISADQFHKVPSQETLNKFAQNGIKREVSEITRILNIGLAKINNLGNTEFDYKRTVNKIKGLWIYSEKVCNEKVYSNPGNTESFYFRGDVQDGYLCVFPETFEKSMQDKRLAFADIFLNSKGYISSCCDGEYTYQDQHNLGNVMSTSLLSMFQELPHIDCEQATHLAVNTSKVKKRYLSN